MKTLIATVVAAGFIFTAQAPANAQMAGLSSLQNNATASQELVHKTGRRGRILGAIALGAVAAIAISEAHRRRSHFARTCRRWRNRCEFGNERACWKYDTRC